MKNKMHLCFLFLTAAAICFGGCSGLLRQDNQTKNSVSETKVQQNNSETKEAEKSEKEFTASYRNLSLTLPPGWSVEVDKKSLCSFAAENGDSLEISFTEGMAKVTLLEFPMSEEEAREAARKEGHLEEDWLVTDFYSKTDQKKETVDYYQYLLNNKHTSACIYKTGIRTAEQAYLITANLANDRSESREELIGILQSLQFLDEERLTEVFAEGIEGETENLSGEETENENPAGTQTARCTSPVNVRTAPNASNSQILGYLETGEVVTVLEIENNWYKIEYQGGIGYAYGDYFEDEE